MRSGIAAHFGEQAETCRALGSPFTADLLLRLTGGAMEGTRFGARIDGWAGDAKADALALRTAGRSMPWRFQERRLNFQLCIRPGRCRMRLFLPG